MYALLVASPLVQLVCDKARRATAVIGTGCSRYAVHPTWAIFDQDFRVIDLEVRGEWTLREHYPSRAKEQVCLFK